MTNAEISSFAASLALHDILRRVIAEVFFDPSSAVFRSRMQAL